MKNYIRFLLGIILSISILSAQEFETGEISVGLSNAGAIEIGAPNFDNLQIDRMSILVGGELNEVFNYSTDSDSVFGARNVDTPSISDFEVEGKVDNRFSGLAPGYAVTINIYGWQNSGFAIVKLNVENIDPTEYDAKVGVEILPIIDDTYGGESYAYISSGEFVRVRRGMLSTVVGFKFLNKPLTDGTAIEWFGEYADSDESLYSYLYHGSIDSEYQSGTDGSVIFLSTDSEILAQGETTELYLAVAVGPNSSDMETNLNAAVEKYGTLTSVEGQDKGNLPTQFNLSQNYPNPFNPTTQISFSIPRAEQVDISVFNTLGEKISQLVQSELEAGDYSLGFNASHLPSGVYFYTIEAGNFTMTKKMMLVK